ncbi:MAG: hypothetical protein KF841_02875 [Phycisphaerae bacterium]|nr:hypothetical protein [Phycisphaerae bacterium]
MAEQVALSVDEQLELALAIAEGSNDALLRLLELYGPRTREVLLGTFRRVLNEDDIDNVLVLAAMKARRAANHFDPDRAEMDGWFYTIAFSSARDFIRRIGGKPALSLDDETFPEPASQASDDNGSRTLAPRARADLLECIESLGELQRAIIEADQALGGGPMEAAVLAKKLGIAKERVYSYRNKAHAALEKCLTRKGYSADSMWNKP